MSIKVLFRYNFQLTSKSENISLHDMMMEADSMKAKYGRSKFLYILLSHMSDLFNFT